ncbi:hypothetical protein [Phenylobacterium sp.]|uniref:hypothetical protein n=1 Tax=Phenylobacterium sp. TaxID=1871053 RepID=UPI0025F43A45|nr:hypothetical protein [Phenylobacterium sp.]MCA6318121.1 hypothetical protein [Phenylobacterium sp.]
MMKSKQKTESSKEFAKGGGAKMAPQQGVKPSKPGQVSTSSAGKSGMNFAKGASGRMAPQQTAAPSKPGQVTTSSGGKGKWGVSGGKTKMFGKQGATPALPGTSSPSSR